MKASPISYVKDAKLRGSVFDPDDTSGLVSSLDSGFFVDHNEPLEALAWVREEMDWPLLNCLMDMNSSLFLKPDVVLDLGLRLGQSLAPSGHHRQQWFSFILCIHSQPISMGREAFALSFVTQGMEERQISEGSFNVYLTNPGGS
jgi:hypothetical protein